MKIETTITVAQATKLFLTLKYFHPEYYTDFKIDYPKAEDKYFLPYAMDKLFREMHKKYKQCVLKDEYIGNSGAVQYEDVSSSEIPEV